MAQTQDLVVTIEIDTSKAVAAFQEAGARAARLARVLATLTPRQIAALRWGHYRNRSRTLYGERKGHR